MGASRVAEMPPVFSVGGFIASINQTLEYAYPRVVIEGEVSSFKIWRERFVYFDLKDNLGTLNCFMSVYQLKTALEDGMKIQIEATVKVTARGRFSATVSSYELAGEGALKRAYELLKSKLEAERLFAPERKRSLPPHPETIGLVTSLQSAAYRDFIEILNQRWGGVTVKVVDVQVQGSSAVDQIVSAIEYCNQLPEALDVLVITRGGGSLEDLQAFSTEPVVRAVGGSRTPTIVGVGHEIDISLADLVADVRAATPTDAARLVVSDKQEVVANISSYESQLIRFTDQEVERKRQSLHHHIQLLQHFLEIPKSRIDNLVANLHHQLQRQQELVRTNGQRITHLEQVLLTTTNQLIQQTSTHYAGLARMLRGISPHSILRQGYAIARSKGKVVKSAQDVKTGDELVLQLAKDQLKTEVKSVQKSAA